MQVIIILFISLVLLFLVIISIGKIINAKRYTIQSETGIQTSEYVTLGGIEQYIQTRGEDISNPIILILHGGPGSTMAYYSYCWQTPFEKDYTIVHWDQRGCGNTYYHDKEAEKPTLDLLLTDLDELVDYLRTKYNKQKLLIMGHSWGTFLAGIYSRKHPEKISAYIGVSQMLDFRKSEQVSAKEAIRLAKDNGNTQDEQEIKRQLELLLQIRKIDQQLAPKFLKLRKLKDKYLPKGQSISALETIMLGIFSPYMTVNDLKWLFNFKALIHSNSELYEALLLGNGLSMYQYGLSYEMPVAIFAGEYDWITPYSLADQYFNDITAPYKTFISMKNVGHVPFMDQSKEFSKVLSDTLVHLP
ncbi:alpha/beta fold hydrolase [Enterococcus sp. DIV0756]|uniref:alpha/beta fold hydrolase n=1 Tax=Enterococcus sp. DIV0756 TaxID=2774636 RepID=UPI003F2157D9